MSKPGRKHPPGRTKQEILRIIFEHPNGVEESKIREILKDRLGIKDMRGVKRHLAALSQEGVITKKEKPGKANLWNVQVESIPKLLDQAELRQVILEWLIKSHDKIVEDEELKLNLDWFTSIIEAFRTEPRVRDLLKTKLFQGLSLYIIDRLVTKAALINLGEIKEEEMIYDLPNRYKRKLMFLAAESPTSFLTIVEFVRSMNLLTWREIKRILRFLEIEQIPVLVPERGVIADVVMKELGILLYSAIKKDIASGVLPRDFLKKLEELEELREERIKVNGRERFFRKIKKLFKHTVYKKE